MLPFSQSTAHASEPWLKLKWGDLVTMGRVWSLYVWARVCGMAVVVIGYWWGFLFWLSGSSRLEALKACLKQNASLHVTWRLETRVDFICANPITANPLIGSIARLWEREVRARAQLARNWSYRPEMTTEIGAAAMRTCTAVLQRTISSQGV